MNVSTVDYRSSEAAKLFSQSLKETGFAVLTNHPIEVDLIDEAYAVWRGFFQSDGKHAYLYQYPSQVGYFPFRSEHAKDSNIGDLKEFYHFYPHEKQPPEIYAATIKLYSALSNLAAELLQWTETYLPKPIANKLSMPLKDMITDSPNTMLRILHYPPLPDAVEDGAVRGAAHEDINMITLLPAATAPGLEVLDAHGQWHAVPCDPGSIVVNVGDSLQKCTEFYFKSTTHRVVNPDDNLKLAPRYSMPLFLHARPCVAIAPGFTAEQYLQQRLREIGY